MRHAARTPSSDSFGRSSVSAPGVLSGTTSHTKTALARVMPVKTRITPRKAAARSSGVAADASPGRSQAKTATESVATSAARSPRPPSRKP